MKKKITFPQPDKKLYHVLINEVSEDGLETEMAFREVQSRKVSVIARTADEAMGKIKLEDNKYHKEFFAGVTLVSEIDVH